MIMRASEFILDEGKASRRKQASMNAKRRMANAQPQTTAPAAEPTATAGPSAPASVATRPNPYMTPQANVPSELDQEVQPAQAQPTQPTQSASTGTDWNALNKATAPAPAQPSAGSSMMGALKQKAMSAGKGIANKFSTQGKVSARTDQIFMDKFLKDMSAAEQTSTGLRGEPFDVKTWVGKYLAQNKWDTGEQQAPLDKAIAANYKPGIAKAMAAIGKYNNLGSTISAKSASAQATAAGTGAMGQMASQLTKAPASTTPTAEPILIGGQTLDPNNPADAKMIAMLQKQGKV